MLKTAINSRQRMRYERKLPDQGQKRLIFETKPTNSQVSIYFIVYKQIKNLKKILFYLTIFCIIIARVKGTAKQIEDLEKQADENMQLTRDAKMKV